MQGFEKRAQLLRELSQTGNLSQYGDLTQTFSYAGAGRDVAASLMQSFVQGEMSLERFAVLLNHAAQLLPANELFLCIDSMNLSYLSTFVPTNNVQVLYEQMLFFDGCALAQAQTHLDNMATGFISHCLAQKTLPKQAVALLNARDLSAKLTQIRTGLLGALQANARGSIAAAPSPQARVKLALRIAAQPGGSLIIDQAMWDEIVNGALSATRNNASVGAEIRALFVRATEGELLDKPKLTLQRMTAALAQVESALNLQPSMQREGAVRRDNQRSTKSALPQFDAQKLLLYTLGALVVVAFIIGLAVFAPKMSGGKQPGDKNQSTTQSTPKPTKKPANTPNQQDEPQSTPKPKKTPAPTEDVIILPEDDVVDDTQVPDEENETPVLPDATPDPTPEPTPPPQEPTPPPQDTAQPVFAQPDDPRPPQPEQSGQPTPDTTQDSPE